jgi:hypothetical protein
MSALPARVRCRRRFGGQADHVPGVQPARTGAGRGCTDDGFVHLSNLSEASGRPRGDGRQTDPVPELQYDGLRGAVERRNDRRSRSGPSEPHGSGPVAPADPGTRRGRGSAAGVGDDGGLWRGPAGGLASALVPGREVFVGTSPAWRSTPWRAGGPRCSRCPSCPGWAKGPRRRKRRRQTRQARRSPQGRRSARRSAPGWCASGRRGRQVNDLISEICSRRHRICTQSISDCPSCPGEAQWQWDLTDRGEVQRCPKLSDE